MDVGTLAAPIPIFLPGDLLPGELAHTPPLRSVDRRKKLGNMISAPAAQLTSTISESLVIHVNGKERPNYGITQAAMMSVIFTLLLIWTACGNEQRGSHFELAKAAGDAGGGVKKEDVEMEEAVEPDEDVVRRD